MLQNCSFVNGFEEKNGRRKIKREHNNVLPLWLRKKDSLSADKPAYGSFVPLAQNSLPFASNPLHSRKKETQ